MSVGFQGALLAQTKTVTGTVTGGDDGLGIPRANVTVKGTTRGTPTDLDGNYTIDVSADETLVFSFIGYVPQEVLVGNQTTINIVLQPDVAMLDEVVVVGYGSQEKKEITSAVASIKPEDFNKGNISDPTQLLQGKVAGLSITRPGGDPNGGFNIRLRGLSTFGANSSPLIVLDGVPGADLNNIDPNDIASIDVLKDGSAAAIYGARGSSGVILITSKSGKGGAARTNITLNSFVSFDNVANTIDVLSPDEFLERGGIDEGSRTDWIDELTQTGVSYATNLSITGGTGSTSYSASVNWRRNEGIIIGAGNERLNTRLNLSHSAINDRLRLNMNLSFTNGENEGISGDAYRQAIIYNPTAPIFDNVGTEVDGGFFQIDSNEFFNPVALARQQKYGGITKQVLASYRAEFDILDNLTASVQYSQDRFNELRGAFWSRQDRLIGAGARGIAERITNDRFTEIITGTLNYSTEVATDLNMTALVGIERQKRTFEGFNTKVRQFLFDSNTWNNLGAGSIRTGANTEVGSYRSTDQLNSAFARLNFTYKGTYFLSASVRAESFSGFGENEKTGYFPALSAGAELTDIADLGPVNSLKLRVSYGITGNLPPSATLALPVLGNGGIVDLDADPLTTNDVYVGLRQLQNQNSGLRWETKREFNLGTDFAIFDGKITGTMDYYTRNVEDLLFNVPVSIGAPSAIDPTLINTASSTWLNLADLQAGGFEFAASYNNIKLGQVSWTPSINFTIYDKTTIESLSFSPEVGFEFIRPQSATPGSPGQNDNPIIENRVGQTLGNFFGPRFLGVDENNSYVLSATETDGFEVIGNALPDGDFGFNNTFVLGDWDLTFFLRGSFGHEIYNSYRGFYENRQADPSSRNSVSTDKTPNILGAATFSDLYIEDASFIRLDNLQLGYNLPTSSDWVSNVRIYAAAQNLFTITDYTGIDPEVRYTDQANGDRFTSSLSPGIERRNTYFTTRTITVGATINFK